MHLLTVVKNLPRGASATVHMVAFTPKPLLIELVPAGEGKMMVGQFTKSATRYVFKPRPGQAFGRLERDNSNPIAPSCQSRKDLPPWVGHHRQRPDVRHRTDRVRCCD